MVNTAAEWVALNAHVSEAIASAWSGDEDRADVQQDSGVPYSTTPRLGVMQVW